MKRRQFPTGNLFNEDGDNAQNQINYAITVPKPKQPVVVPQPQITNQRQQILTIEEQDYRQTLFAQENNCPSEELQTQQVETHDENHEAITQQPVHADLSKAQQLIQQSQALLKKRKLGQNAKQPEIRNQPIEEKQKVEVNQQVQLRTISAQVQTAIPNSNTNANTNVNEQNEESPIQLSYSLIHQFAAYQQGQLKVNLCQSTYIKNYPGPCLQKSQMKSVEYQRQLRYFWNQLHVDSKLLQLAINNVERNIFRDSRNASITFIETQLLNDLGGQQFIQAYTQVFHEERQSQEQKLFLTLLQSDQINILQQPSVIEYLQNKSFANDNEALVMMLAFILKMEQTETKEIYYQDLIESLLTTYRNQELTSRLLWLALKMYPSYVNDRNLNFPHFLLSFFSNQLQFPFANSEIQILLADSYAYFRNQQNPEIYYKLGLLYIENGNFQKALECSKYALDLGCQIARDLRDRVLLVMDIQEKNKSNSQQSGGFLNYFAKKVDPPPVKQESKEPNFYFDKSLNAWVINGVPQVEEEIQQNATVPAQIAPPPPPKVVQQKSQTEQKIVKQQADVSPQSQLIPQQIPQSSLTQSVQNPFGQHFDQQTTSERQKKNHLLRNRYVQ